MEVQKWKFIFVVGCKKYQFIKLRLALKYVKKLMYG